jgi:hypothetical protein
MSNVSVRLYNEVMMLDSFTCVYCGLQDPELTIDHVIPRSEGGSDIIQNLVACCGLCNGKKGSKALYEAEMFPLYGRFSYVIVNISRKTTSDLLSLKARIRDMERGGFDAPAIGAMLYEAIGVQSAADKVKVERVRTLLRAGTPVSQVIKQVWGAEGGRAYQLAAQEMSTILAQLV